MNSEQMLKLSKVARNDPAVYMIYNLLDAHNFPVEIQIDKMILLIEVLANNNARITKYLEQEIATRTVLPGMTMMLQDQASAWEKVFKLCQELGMPPFMGSGLDRVTNFIKDLANNTDSAFEDAWTKVYMTCLMNGMSLEENGLTGIQRVQKFLQEHLK